MGGEGGRTAGYYYRGGGGGGGGGVGGGGVGTGVVGTGAVGGGEAWNAEGRGTYAPGEVQKCTNKCMCRASDTFIHTKIELVGSNPTQGC